MENLKISTTTNNRFNNDIIRNENHFKQALLQQIFQEMKSEAQDGSFSLTKKDQKTIELSADPATVSCFSKFTRELQDMFFVANSSKKPTSFAIVDGPLGIFCIKNLGKEKENFEVNVIGEELSYFPGILKPKLSTIVIHLAESLNAECLPRAEKMKVIGEIHTSYQPTDTFTLHFKN